MKLCITGANSSVGRNLLKHLPPGPDYQATALVRSSKAAEGLPSADNIEPRVLDYADDAAMLAASQGVDVIVHLAGVLFQSKHSSYQSANVDSTAAVIRAARAAGVPQIIFISVLGADPKSRNGFYRSKGQAEKLLIESGIATTILRTPLLIGPESAGGKALLREARSGHAKLLGGGDHYVQPLDVDDLSVAILAACHQPKGARVLTLCGPTRKPYRSLVERVAAQEARELQIDAIPIWVVKLLSGLSYLVKRSGMSPAIVDVITASEIVESDGDTALGIKLTPLGRTLSKLTATAPLT